MVQVRDKYQAITTPAMSPRITLKIVNTLTTVTFSDMALLWTVTSSVIVFQDRHPLTIYGSMITICITTLKTQNIKISPITCICVS